MLILYWVRKKRSTSWNKTRSDKLFENVYSIYKQAERKIIYADKKEYISHVMEKTGYDHSSVKPHLYNYFRMLFKD